MSKLRCHISISADGFVAGPNQSEENPLGEGGERLHDWAVSLAAWRESHDKQGGEVNESTRIIEESRENVGAGVMGRNMFGPPGGGDWADEEWKGWWGDDPPYHNDVFILTHHPREPVEMEGGTTFHFVTDGIERALERAKESADGQDVMLWGGAQVVQQYLAAGLLDELELHIAPVLLGDGALRPLRRHADDRPRRDDRERRSAVNPGGPGLQPERPRVGRQRIPDRVRRPPAALGTDRRSDRPAARLLGRARRLHRRVPALRARPEPGSFDRSPLRPGSRRSAHLRGHPRDDRDHVPGAPGAGEGDRGVIGSHERSPMPFIATACVCGWY